MNISMNKIMTLTTFKFKELFKNKTFIISAVLVPVLTLAMRFVYQNMLEGEELPVELLAMVLNLGVLYNINAISLMMPATMMAKDKERYTLRTLMTSSVNSAEYFVSGIIPSLTMSVLINIVVMIIGSIPMSSSDMILYFIVTTIASITSCIIGMIVGIFSKNQMNSSNMITVLMMILMMIPLFGSLVDSLDVFNRFLYTGIVSSLITDLAGTTSGSLDILSWIILLGGIVLVIIAFILCYKKNGFEKD